MKYTIVGQFEGGESWVEAIEAESVEAAIKQVFEVDVEQEGMTPPDSIIAVFKGECFDVLGEFHDGAYSFSYDDYKNLKEAYGE